MCLCASLCVTLSCVMCSSGLSGSVMNPYGPVGICLRYSWGQPNELDPYTVIIRLITMFRYKMTKINRENARSRSAAKGWLDNVDRRRVSRSAASWMLRSLGKVSQRREKIHRKEMFKNGIRCACCCCLHMKMTANGWRSLILRRDIWWRRSALFVLVACPRTVWHLA